MATVMKKFVSHCVSNQVHNSMLAFNKNFLLLCILIFLCANFLQHISLIAFSPKIFYFINDLFYLYSIPFLSSEIMCLDMHCPFYCVDALAVRLRCPPNLCSI